jgi:hypothetical protein
LWKTRWRGARIVVISAAIPIVAFLAALLVAHCHH